MIDDRAAGDAVSSRLERGLAGLLSGRPRLTARPASDLRCAVEIDDVAWHGTPATPLDGLLHAGAALLLQATSASRAAARAAAAEARALAAFARVRPQSAFDRQPGERGAMSAASRDARPEALTEVSEWAADEVAVALRINASAATTRLVEALVLVERLPATLALLEAGRISWAHARQMIAQVGPVADDALRGRVEARVLGLLKDKTPPQLGDCARRIVLREDADAAARKLVAAVRGRGVRLFDRRDGSGSLQLDLPLPVAVAVHRALEAHAEQARTDGDERTKQQRMADVVADLLLRPGESGLPPVSIALTLVATLETMLGGSEPGQVDGHLVPAEAVRELGYTFGLMPRPEPVPVASEPGPEPERTQEPVAGPEPAPGTDPPLLPPDEPTSDAEPAHGSVPVPGAASEATPVRDRPLSEWLAGAAARDRAAVEAALTGADRAISDGTWTDGEERALLDLGALMGVRDVAGTGLAHRPHIAVVDMLRGSLVALTDATGIRRGEALGPPDGTDEHDPSAALDRFVRLRDRRCRFPGCRARARTCDLDHRREWPHGPTTHDNLCCLCEHHHRLKHQAPGWRFDAPDGSGDPHRDDGALVVTTPSGDTRISHPPRFGSDLDVPPY